MAGISIKNPFPSIFRAVALDALMSRHTRRELLGINFIICLLSAVFLGFIFLIRFAALNSPQFVQDRLWGGIYNIGYYPFFPIFFIAAAFFLALFFLEFFYVSSLRPVAVCERDGESFAIDFEAAKVFYPLAFLNEDGAVPARDVHRVLAASPFFEVILLRLGIFQDDYLRFAGGVDERLLQRSAVLDAALSSASKRDDKVVGLGEVVEAVFARDKAFSRFMFEREVHKEELEGAAYWASQTFEADRERLFVWTKKRLGRIPGMGKSFGFGYTYELDKYSRDITGSLAPVHLEARKREILVVEDVLSKTGHANVLLVGDEGVGRHTILEGLARMIQEGKSYPAIEYKRMTLVDIDSMAAVAKTKGNFESLALAVFGEAVQAGNIIMVIENFPHAVSSASEIGSDFITLIEPFIAGHTLQLIATSNISDYHKFLERLGKVATLFEKVSVNEPARERSILILEEVAERLEAVAKKFFTYQAIERVVETSEKYLPEGVMPEKAVELLDAVANMALEGDRMVIYPRDVDYMVSKRTKIPLGEAEEEEKEKLLNLENLLHKRIVNQKEAVRTVADALRRARTGLENEKKPLGSFLFLGPTGVGKTETAKALAGIYFGGEDSMTRFDMSEYQGDEGFNKLVGSFESGEPGVLANRVRERPFGLLLFDEFEKSSKNVLNLFLQILDEGQFADAMGKRVSLRQTMIIATSNAGADLIWDLVKQGRDPSSVKRTVIDEIRKEGKFSPELLNRFDAMVVFHPLNPEHLREVARLMLGRLADNLKEKDIALELSEPLINKVAEIGYDPTFGARPMRRAIADRVEEIIAKKILKGELKRGSVFKFSNDEIAKL